MPEISQCYTVNLMTLSPLHIGSGRKLLRDYDYAVHQGRTWRIDEDALLDAALGQDPGEWDEAILRQPAADLLQPADYKASSGLFRYVAHGAPRSKEKGAHLREQIKDAWDRPYLPGSSLKGALRTALLAHALDQNPRALNLSRLRDNRKWASQPIERAALGRNPNYDLLRALQVGDSQPLPPDKALTIVNAQVLTGGQPGSPIEVEALRPELTLRSSIKLDLALFTPSAERKLQLGDRREWLTGLMDLCRARVTPLIQREQDWFAQRYPRSQIAGFYSQLYQLAQELPSERTLLQIGWGGGWHSKSVGERLNERERENVIRRYRLARGKRRPGDPFPKSRRATLDHQGQPRRPLGWVLMEMKPA